ncbi:MAG: hypothetical protein K2J82_12845 [Muribaculaceae bacterium]|nr:hypothetical protein [Muribaculaceae bacterium]
MSNSVIIAITLIIIAILFFIVKIFEDRRNLRKTGSPADNSNFSQDEKEKSHASNPDAEAGPNTVPEHPDSASSSSGDKEKNNNNYICSIISAIGCQPKHNDNGAISFHYQGEEFFLDYNGTYLRIWDPSWAHIELSNPAFPNLLKAINESNYSFGPTILYTRPDASGVVVLHSRYDIFFPSDANNDPDFLKASLMLFFDAKHTLTKNIKKIDDEGIANPNPATLNPLVPSEN